MYGVGERGEGGGGGKAWGKFPLGPQQAAASLVTDITMVTCDIPGADPGFLKGGGGVHLRRGYRIS